MVVAMGLALTVNAAFGMVMGNATTHGQRIYDAWYYSGGATMYADASGVLRKLCDKG
ncbi:MAG: hypothetical protein ACHQIO_00705 [Nevskiales bacterium]